MTNRSTYPHHADSYAEFLRAFRRTLDKGRVEFSEGSAALDGMGSEGYRVAVNLLRSMVLRLAAAEGRSVVEVLDDLTVTETMIDPEEDQA